MLILPISGSCASVNQFPHLHTRLTSLFQMLFLQLGLCENLKFIIGMATQSSPRGWHQLRGPPDSVGQTFASPGFIQVNPGRNLGHRQASGSLPLFRKYISQKSRRTLPLWGTEAGPHSFRVTRSGRGEGVCVFQSLSPRQWVMKDELARPRKANLKGVLGPLLRSPGLAGQLGPPSLCRRPPFPSGELAPSPPFDPHLSTQNCSSALVSMRTPVFLVVPVRLHFPDCPARHLDPSGPSPTLPPFLSVLQFPGGRADRTDQVALLTVSSYTPSRIQASDLRRRAQACWGATDSSTTLQIAHAPQHIFVKFLQAFPGFTGFCANHRSH
jgi:hypothetical protein